MKHSPFLIVIHLMLIAALPLGAGPVHAQEEPVIRAVLFYSPSCPHCLDVINETLPPLVNQYGTQLQIFGVDTYTQEGGELFDAANDLYNNNPNNRGVPSLVVGDQMLIGSVEIPEKLPGIIEQGLQEGGIDWPDIPGLQAARAAAEEEAETPNNPVPHNPSLRDRFMGDLAGNILSVVVLVGMIGAVIGMGFFLQKPDNPGLQRPTNWLIPVLALIGAGVAAYLAYIEFTQTEAVCGPVGKCNTVQQSSYATLFGVIPIGFLGLLGYLIILLAWGLQSYGPKRWQKGISLFLWTITAFGTLFSIYLTFLEPFVIGASCMWCLGSAVIMTALFILATGNAKPYLVFEKLQM